MTETTDQKLRETRVTTYPYLFAYRRTRRADLKLKTWDEIKTTMSFTTRNMCLRLASYLQDSYVILPENGLSTHSKTSYTTDLLQNVRLIYTKTNKRHGNDLLGMN